MNVINSKRLRIAAIALGVLVVLGTGIWMWLTRPVHVRGYLGHINVDISSGNGTASMTTYFEVLNEQGERQIFICKEKSACAVNTFALNSHIEFDSPGLPVVIGGRSLYVPEVSAAITGADKQ